MKTAIKHNDDPSKPPRFEVRYQRVGDLVHCEMNGSAGELSDALEALSELIRSENQNQQ